MLGRLACRWGFHRVVTTREGKTKGSAAHHIHCFCYRPNCKFHAIIDTHSGRKEIIKDEHTDHGAFAP